MLGLGDRVTALAPRPAGIVTGEFPVPTGRAHVLTASDPGPVVLPAPENRRRRRELVAGLPARTRHWPVVTGAADGSHTEAGVLVTGLRDDEARARGARWGQDAIFGWTPAAWEILPCEGGCGIRLGWALSSVPETDPLARTLLGDGRSSRRR